MEVLYDTVSYNKMLHILQPFRYPANDISME